MSENPTDPNPTDTVNAATETGETMIPLSAVEPLLQWAQQQIVTAPADLLLNVAYDHASRSLGVASLSRLSSEPYPVAMKRLPPLAWNRDYLKK